MAPVRVLFPGRSDGISSGPTAAQLEHKRSSNTTQFYQEVTLFEDKSKDWRKKLAGMIISQLEKDRSEENGTEWKADPDPNMTYILHEFPVGYRLYEHHTVHDGEGARDRRDTYLYGHPGGVKKRFRTPKEFFLHLYWLLTDETCNPENCACKLCVSDELLKEVEAFVGQSAKEPLQLSMADTNSTPNIITDSPPPPPPSPPPPQTTVTPQTTASRTGQVNIGLPSATPSALNIPATSTISSSSKTAPLNLMATQSAARVSTAPVASKTIQPRPSSSGRPAPQSRMAPSELPGARNEEQSQDVAAGSFLYRVGELVWYNKGQAVGLAVIKGRDITPSTSSSSQLADSFFYTLQPLSYPGATYELKRENEAAMKPWYAYSPPMATHQHLNRADMAQLAFSRIDWQSVLAGAYGPGDADVDASIFAAKTMDRSYTPIECINNTGTQLYYNGIYLGSEKIWRGDAVTLRSHQPLAPGASQPLEILIVIDITETMQAAATPSGSAAPANTMHLVGDRYTYTSEPVNIPPNVSNVQAFLRGRVPTRIPVLPGRVAEDLLFQNQVSVMRKQVANSWRLTAAQTRISVSDIRGRWYETTRMLPIINPANFQRMRDVTGEIHDVGRSLNARGEAGGVGQTGSPGSRFASRREVLDRSVPQTFRLDSAH